MELSAVTDFIYSNATLKSSLGTANAQQLFAHVMEASSLLTIAAEALNWDQAALQSAFPHLNARQIHRIVTHHNTEETLGITASVFDGFAKRFAVDKLVLELDQSDAQRACLEYKLV